MREILFRGKTVFGEWIEGVPMFFTDEYAQICRPMQHGRSIIPETVGQYTGVTDKNGTKIFEGDIVLLHINDQYYRSLICYSGQSCRFTVKTKLCGYWRHYPLNDRQQLNVIGNIHDNPDLLKGGAE